MRSRDKIEKDSCYDEQDLTMEVLLDIRELLLIIENKIANATKEGKRR